VGFFCRILSDFVRCELALQKKDIVAAKAKENQIRKSVSVNSPEQKPVDTRRISKASRCIPRHGGFELRIEPLAGFTGTAQI
jgi:hypothetical protein